jgi:hypothetical protein
MFASLLALGCNVTAVDHRAAMPEWFSAMGRVNGVNLHHLERYDRFREFVEDPSFARNLAAMEWNTFRLPVEWDQYAGAGGVLNRSAVDAAISNLRILVSNLRVARRAAGLGDPVLLIIDFHQYKFGGVCGGVGVPRGVIDETGLSPNDSNCMFLAFERFWRSAEAQRKWFAWARAFIEELPSILREDGNWLKIGIEPMNEPQFGFAEPIFTDQMVTTAWNVYNFARSGAVQAQIDNKLIPFYRSFMAAVQTVPGFDLIVDNGVFVFDPFVLDFLDVSLHLGPLELSITIDGHYDGMGALTTPAAGKVRWIAAPHHYVGAMDNGFISMLPEFARTQLSRYPNIFVDRARIRDRFRWIEARMAEAGMETIYGEWGTETGLLNAEGRAGGYRAWIADTKSAMASHSKGGLWWQYVQDRSADQRAFYLLRGKDDSGADIPWHQQILKCSGRHNLARLVFGRCPE